LEEDLHFLSWSFDRGEGSMQTWEIVTIIVAVLVLVAALAWVYSLRQRSRRLQAHFGQEYDRTVEQFGDRRRAESNLSRRVARVNRLNIHPLSASDRRRFVAEWKACQAHFVDDPVEAVYDADQTILAMMRSRGYGAEDVGRRFEDISATHPHLAADYRQAHDIVARHRRAEATTEDMRQAMVHYQKIFTELLGEERHEEFERAA
jgi:hypothetical protein